MEDRCYTNVLACASMLLVLLWVVSTADGRRARHMAVLGHLERRVMFLIGDIGGMETLSAYRSEASPSNIHFS